jgi:uncharacterized damage-inducible protein DinB
MALGKHELIDLSDQAWERLWGRLEGLSDDEYLWEPAPGCWSIRPTDSDRWRSDGSLPRPDPEPFTTIAWRLWHLIDLYGENRAPRWLDVPEQGGAIGLDDPNGSPPPTAAAALLLLERAHQRWDAHLAIVTDEQLAERVGPVGGQYADRTRTNYVLHMLDEYIHHGAEVALLRDLWRWQHPADTDVLRERTIRGDVSVVGDAGDRALELLALAADYSRWDLVASFVDAGISPNTGGHTPLHRAAIVGALDLVELLVDHGADVNARDPQFDATPLQWAQFTERVAVAEWLTAHGAHE